MRHVFLVVVGSLILWGASLFGAPRALPATPAPQASPTSVLPLLASSPTWAGRYHSPLAPYSVASAWPGHPVAGPGAAYDLFDGGSAEIAVLTEANTHHLDSQAAEQHLRALIIQESMTPALISSVEVAGQRHVAVLAFSGADGVFAAATFVATGRVWIVQLSSTYARQEQDWQVLRRFLLSMRLDHTVVASRQ